MHGRIKKIVMSILLLVAVMTFAAEPTVSNVTAKQRYPWNGLVDITCKVTGINGTTNGLEFAVSAVMPDSGDIRSVSRFWVVQSGTNSTDRQVHTNGNYRLLWDAQADLDSKIYSNMVVRVAINKFHDQVQLWENGPFWAKTNIGAEEPWECGCFFWWGDTVGYKWEGYKWVATDGSSADFKFVYDNPIIQQTYGKDLEDLKRDGWVSSDNILLPEHDAAHVHWGGGWRMPKFSEFSDLAQNCDVTWTTTNGVNGYVIRGRGVYASECIFLPCAGSSSQLQGYDDYNYSGIYWSSESDLGTNYSFLLYFRQGKFEPSEFVRYRGQPIRPVRDVAN